MSHEHSREKVVGNEKSTIPKDCGQFLSRCPQVTARVCTNGDILGRGAFATVYLARKRRRGSTDSRIFNASGECVALKVVNVSKIALSYKRPDNNNTDRISNNQLETTDALFGSSYRGCDSGASDNDDNIEAVWNMLQREIHVHMSVSSHGHPNIVRLLESFQFTAFDGGIQSNFAAMILEYCMRGDLHTYLKRQRDKRQCNHDLSSSETLIPEEEARYAMGQVLQGLSFLHSRGIVHRDIKCANILLVPLPSIQPMVADGCFSLLECVLKIGDFGLAVQMSTNDDWDEAQHTVCGTPSCLAPEVVTSTPHTRKIDITDSIADSCIASQNNCLFTSKQSWLHSNEKGHGQPADLWSCGCLLYTMLVGSYPFSNKKGDENSQPKANRIQDTLNRVINGVWKVPPHIRLSEHASSLLHQLLSLDPGSRGLARGILSAHPFFVESRAIKKRSLVEHQNEPITKHVQLLQTAELILDENKWKTRSANHDLSISTKEIASSMGDVTIEKFRNIHRFFPFKKRWKEERQCKLSANRVARFRVYTVIVLPKAGGTVIQCEDERDRGVWLYVSSDGESIGIGPLIPNSSRVPNIGRCDTAMTAIHDVDSHKLKIANNKSDGGLNRCWSTSAIVDCKRMNQSFESTTILSYPCVNSRTQTARMPLTSLLLAKYRPFLMMYRKLMLFLEKEEKQRLKVVLHAVAHHKDQFISICETALMENAGSIFMTCLFSDGIVVRHEQSSNYTEIYDRRKGSEILSFTSELLSDTERMKWLKASNRSESVKHYRKHLDLSIKCMKNALLLMNGMRHFPIQKCILAQGKDSEKWLLFDT